VKWIRPGKTIGREAKNRWESKTVIPSNLDPPSQPETVKLMQPTTRLKLIAASRAKINQQGNQ
jgi:hypothetical protein